MSAHRVLICSNLYPPHFVGGAELIAHEYAKCLSRLGHPVLVFAGETRALRPRHAAWRDSYDGVPVVRVALDHHDFSPDAVNFSHPDLDIHFSALLEEFQPTIVHCHNLTGLSAGVLHRARTRQLPTVVTLHDHWGFCYRNTLMKHPAQVCRDHRRCAECLPFVSDHTGRRIPIRLRNDFLALELGLADLLVSPSRYLADRYMQAGFSPDQLRIIPYGIDVARFAPLQRRSVPARLRFTFVGYFGEHKGLRTVLGALTYLGEMRDRFELRLVGDGELLAGIRQHVIDQGWDRTVLLPGKMDNARIEAVYRQTDVLLLPSIWPENQPVSITEAMAAGIPVVASRVGGIPELVEDGGTGFLIDPGDPVQLATRMAALIENPGLVAELGAKAAQRVASNTLERRIAEYVASYDAIHAASGQGPATRPLVVCMGKRFSLACSSAIDALSRTAMEPCFVMREWIDDRLLARAALIWVVDEDFDLEEVVTAASGGVALLVPTAAAPLHRLCVEGNFGLDYRDEYEAAACLELLMRDRHTREALGRNAARHVRPVHTSPRATSRRWMRYRWPDRHSR